MSNANKERVLAWICILAGAFIIVNAFMTVPFEKAKFSVIVGGPFILLGVLRLRKLERTMQQEQEEVRSSTDQIPRMNAASRSMPQQQVNVMDKVTSLVNKFNEAKQSFTKKTEASYLDGYSKAEVEAMVKQHLKEKNIETKGEVPDVSQGKPVRII